jgi:hypothetical protein
MKSNRNLHWRHLKALHQIYSKGQTKNKIQDHPYIDYLIRKNYLRQKLGRSNTLIPDHGFEEYYKIEHLRTYEEMEKFLVENDALKIQSNYKEEDIKKLMFIKSQKEQILKDKYSRRTFSTVFFGKENSKYLESHQGLEDAVFNIIGPFALRDPKDQQYRFVVDCPNPEVIVLCENIDFLTTPWVSRENNIELWYAGGNNIKKLDHLPTIELPIFYSCDWDYDGLRIYERVREKIPEIRLLYPSAIENLKPVVSENHKSIWKENQDFSGLKAQLYNEQERSLINSLIKKAKWIEEESNDLVEMLRMQGVWN